MLCTSLHLVLILLSGTFNHGLKFHLFVYYMRIIFIISSFLVCSFKLYAQHENDDFKMMIDSAISMKYAQVSNSKKVNSSIESNIDSFRISAVEFVKQEKILNTIDLKGVVKSITCPITYTALKEEEIADELKLFRNQVLYYHYNGSIIELLNDSCFVTEFYKRAINKEVDYYQIEHLRFLKFDSAKVSGYGDCIIASFRYSTPTSANQDQPTIIFNIEKNEIIIWNFSNWFTRKGVIELDFKVRGGRHTLYRVGYDVKTQEFIPHCYEIITMK